MPLYKGKTTIQALGGNRIEWKARFTVQQAGEMLVSAPPCNIEILQENGGLPEEWSVQIDAPGEVVLEGYDLAYQDADAANFRGFIACEWNNATRTMVLHRRGWGGGGNQVLNPGDSALLTLWIRNTAVVLDYRGQP